MTIMPQLKESKPRMRFLLMLIVITGLSAIFWITGERSDAVASDTVAKPTAKAAETVVDVTSKTPDVVAEPSSTNAAPLVLAKNKPAPIPSPEIIAEVAAPAVMVAAASTPATTEFAAAESAPTVREPDAPASVSANAAKPVIRKVTMDEVVRLVLENNLDVKIRMVVPDIEAARLYQSRGAFNPSLGFDGRYESLNIPQNAQQFSATGGTLLELNQLNGNPRIFDEDNWRWKSSFGGKLPTGTKYELFHQVDVLKNTLNDSSPLSLFSPEYQSFHGITVTQPLLREFGTDVNMAEIRVARQNLQISNLELKSMLTSAVAEVLKSYFELLFSDEEMKLKEEEVGLGKRLTEDKRNQLEKGRISVRDLGRAQSAVAESVERLVVARNQRLERHSSFLRLISSDYDLNDLTTWVPDQELETEELKFNREQLIAEALRNRPDYLAAMAKVKREDIKLTFAKNLIWPKLDLKSTMGYNGLAGTWEESNSRAWSQQGTQWSVGVLFSYPLGNFDARGKRNEAEKVKEQSILTLKQVELTSVLEVQKFLAIVDSNYERLRAMSTYRSQADENFESEQTRLEKGFTTEVELLKVRRDLTEARTRELAATAEYNKSLVQLWAATGTLLDRWKITVEE